MAGCQELPGPMDARKKKKRWFIFAPYIRFLENLAIRMNYLWGFIGEYKENYFLRFPLLFGGKSSKLAQKHPVFGMFLTSSFAV